MGREKVEWREKWENRDVKGYNLKGRLIQTNNAIVSGHCTVNTKMGKRNLGKKME